LEEKVASGGSVRVERVVSDVIGPLPKTAPKKLRGRLGDGRVEDGAAEDRFGIGASCPRVSVVMGDVNDIGESYRRPCAHGGDIPFKRVSKTTYPMRHRFFND
jgi:hypothetical protein